MTAWQACAAKALAFSQAAFGAVERFRMPGPGDTVMHGEFQIGDSVLMFADEAPDWGALSPESTGGRPLSLNLYGPDCDAVIADAAAWARRRGRSSHRAI
jgi:PhnB protein